MFAVQKEQIQCLDTLKNLDAFLDAMSRVVVRRFDLIWNIVDQSWDNIKI